MQIPDVPDMVVGAMFAHDIREDCPQFKLYESWEPYEVSREVYDWVGYVTNPSKEYPKLRRAVRKKMDCDHLVNVPMWAKVMKMVDRTDNLGDLVFADDDSFKRLYVFESYQLLDVLLREEHPILVGLSDEYIDNIRTIEKQLGTDAESVMRR